MRKRPLCGEKGNMVQYTLIKNRVTLQFHRQKGPWKYIDRLKETVYKYITCKMGSDDNTRFWTDF